MLCKAAGYKNSTVCKIVLFLSSCIFIKCSKGPLVNNKFELTVLRTAIAGQRKDGHLYNTFFMYWRPILWTLYGAVDFLKVLKIAVVWGGVLLVHSAYIMSQLILSGIKYWDVMYTLCPS